MELPAADCIDWGAPVLDRSDEVKATFTIPYRWKPGGFVRFAAAMGVNLAAALPLPGHDPPVAWRGGGSGFYDGISMVMCPSLRTAPVLGKLPDDIPLLDSEPGRSPVRP